MICHCRSNWVTHICIVSSILIEIGHVIYFHRIHIIKYHLFNIMSVQCCAYCELLHVCTRIFYSSGDLIIKFIPH